MMTDVTRSAVSPTSQWARALVGMKTMAAAVTDYYQGAEFTRGVSRPTGYPSGHPKPSAA